MKNIFAVIACVMVVTACGWMPPKFDNVQYNNIVTLKYYVESVGEVCGTDKVKQTLPALQMYAHINSTYVSHTREDDNVKQSIVIIRQQIEELADKYNEPQAPSKQYCSLKVQIIDEGVSAILATTGDRSR